MHPNKKRRITKILLISILSVLVLLLLFPSFIIIKNIQNDMPLREYIKETVLRRIKSDFKRFFIFSENPTIKIPVLFLEIEPGELKKLEMMRTLRLAEIQNHQVVEMGQDHWDFVNGKIKYNNEEHIIKIRIRGDMPSNYNRGIDKASYRFNIESNTSLFGKKKLSLVGAFLENNFYGYLFSHFLDKEGFVSNDVMFVRLIFNGEDTGICFLQEGFSKELAESSDFREGTILRFKNDCIDNNGEYNSTGMPDLVAYSEKRTMKDSALSNIYNRALTKFDLLKNKKLSVEKCFNLDKFSKYLALCDIFLAHHSSVCHNAKLYFNPVNDKLEPIAWDPSNFMRYQVKLPVQPGFTNVSGEIYNRQSSYPLHHLLYSDTSFLRTFNQYLFQYASDSSIVKFIKQHEDIIALLDPILYRQRFQERFHPEWILNNINSIKNWYTTNTRLNAKIFRNEGIVVVNSTLPIALHLTKLKLDSSKVIYLDKVLLPFQSDTIHFAASMLSPEDKKFTLFSSVFGFEEEQKYKGNIFEKLDQYNTPLISEITDSLLLKFDAANKKISFRTNKISINKNLYIPPGYQLIIPAGTVIELTNHSNIISESAVEAIGKSEKKIYFHSDGTGGFFVKNANSPSTLEFVEFDNLSNPQSGNWSLTGAVTFYESEVSFNNCIFKNNFSEDALNVIRCNFTIQNSFVSHTYADAIDIDFSSGKIVNTTIENTQNDGLDFSASNVELNNINLSHIGDKAVSGGENTFATLENITIRDSFIGISSKDKSIIKSGNLVIENTKYSLASYQKKDEYGPATILLNNYKNKGKQNDFLIEKNSLLVIDGDSLIGEAINVYDLLYKK